MQMMNVRDVSTMSRGCGISYSLKTAEDVRRLRGDFFSRLLAGYSPGAGTLELGGGAERVAALFPDASVESMQAEDLTRHPASSTYQQIVWFNGLNWARPRQQAILNAIRARMRSGGRLFLSCAAHFSFLNESPSIEWEVANKLRSELDGSPPGQDFSDLRFSIDELRRLFFGWRVLGFEHVEADVDLELEAFNEWHGGSVKCLLGDLLEHSPGLREEFLKNLHDLYREGVYQPRLGTALVIAEMPS